MDNLNQDMIEKEFLSILMIKPNIGFDLLQVRPKCLKNPKHELIFRGIMFSKNKFGIIDLAGVLAYNKILTPEMLVEIISDELVPLTDVRKQFMVCQKIILTNYKKKRIEELSQELSQNKIDCDVYLNEMNKINEFVIKDETNILTEEEIKENISTEKIGIELNNFKLLNDTLKLVQGDFLMIGASTGVGKSGLMLNLMNDLMDRYQCIYFNMEMSKSTIYKRILSIKSGVPIYSIDKPETEYQNSLIEKATNEVVGNQVIIEHKASYLHEIKAVLGKHKDDQKHTIIFLDHIGLIKNASKKSIYEQTTEVAKQLRQFCLDYDCTIISACQLNRTSYNSKELNLAMLKDSGELENSSSKVVLLYKNKENTSKEKYVDNMVVDIVKNRDGRLGKISFKYDKTKQIFEEEKNYG